MTWNACIAGLALVVALTTGCAARGVGDPCIPETTEGEQLDRREHYIETSSLQCRSRTCVVFKLAGDPTRVLEDGTCPDNVDCVSRELPVTAPNSLERVFCSCRCRASGGDANTPLCDCGEGFHCVDLVDRGGVGVRGGYCVPDELCTADADCATGRCNFDTGVCATST
ncbi:hypothetical protein [Sandaracinus amylolyticus]|uniref:hypothetical protein n=1 Tax=Sandaracinus amylolyticus TaxID=927083 RepID=UPI001F4526B9|nr:hypothetical protein [Sandaracinus amylolyticus]UJR84205.1 Hypothetical protein I5071_62760 [Sandaracinus amylolyticus]